MLMYRTYHNKAGAVVFNYDSGSVFNSSDDLRKVFTTGTINVHKKAANDFFAVRAAKNNPNTSQNLSVGAHDEENGEK